MGLNLVVVNGSPLDAATVSLSELNLFAAEAAVGADAAGAAEADADSAGAAEASVDLTSWRDSSLDSFDVDLPDATGRAGRLKDAPQALAPIVEETTGGIAALGRAFFVGADTNEYGFYEEPVDPYSDRRRQAEPSDDEPVLAETAPPAEEPPAKEELASTSTVEKQGSGLFASAPTRTQAPTRTAAPEPAPTRTPRPAIRSLAPPASRTVAFWASPAEPSYIDFNDSPASKPPLRATDANALAPTDTVLRRLRLSAPGPRKRGLGWGSSHADIASAEAQCGLASGLLVFVAALAFAAVTALVAYSQAHSQRLAVVTGAVAILACGQIHCEGVDSVIDGLRWAFNEGAGSLFAAARWRWTFNMAVGHTQQFAVILLLPTYIATAGASPVKSATRARRRPRSLSVSQLIHESDKSA